MHKATTWGASPSDWQSLDLMQGLTADLLPVVSNPQAKISPHSKMQALGKTPSRYNAQGFVAGFPGWTSHESTGDEVAAWSRNPDYGICLQTRHVRAIDIDILDEGIASDIEHLVVSALGQLPMRRRADSSKRLAFFFLEGEFSKRVLHIGEGLVEFLATGQQFIVAGTHPNGARYEVDGGLENVDVPSVDAEAFEALWQALADTYAGGDWTEAGGQRRSKQLQAAAASDPVAQFLDEHGWTKEQSKDGTRYIRCPFEHEHSGDSGVTATAYFLAHTHGYINSHFRCLHAHCAGRDDRAFLDEIGYTDLAFDGLSAVDAKVQQYRSVQTFVQQVDDAADEFELRERVCEAIKRADDLDDIDRERLAQVVKVRMQMLGSPIPLGAARGLVARVKHVDTGFPEWLKGWVYVTESDKFFQCGHNRSLTMQGFCAVFNRELDSELEVENAARAALDFYHIPTLDRTMYVPWAAETFNTSGMRCANLYRPNSVPRAVESLSAEGQAAVDVVLRHINLICGNRPQIVNHLIDWIAHNVQQPGVKIRHAPLIKGIEGDGKSVLGQLIGAVMGPDNTTDIPSAVLQTSFNGYAEGNCVGILEEVKMDKGSLDTANNIKVIISNDRVPIHRKGRDAYNVVNVTNYIAFTNHTDAVPLSDTDRRWFIIFSPFQCIDDVRQAIGEDTSAYFNRLHDALKRQPGALRRWFLDRDVSAFDRNKHAPTTVEKATMRATSAYDSDRIVKDILQDGANGISEDVVSVTHLAAELVARGEDAISPRTLAKILGGMGFAPAGKVGWQGSRPYIWVRTSVIADPEHADKGAIRGLLDSTSSIATGLI